MIKDVIIPDNGSLMTFEDRGWWRFTDAQEEKSESGSSEQQAMRE
jgi:hypothetical protein